MTLHNLLSQIHIPIIKANHDSHINTLKNVLQYMVIMKKDKTQLRNMLQHLTMSLENEEKLWQKIYENEQNPNAQVVPLEALLQEMTIPIHNKHSSNILKHNSANMMNNNKTRLVLKMTKLIGLLDHINNEDIQNNKSALMHHKDILNNKENHKFNKVLLHKDLDNLIFNLQTLLALRTRETTPGIMKESLNNAIQLKVNAPASTPKKNHYRNRIKVSGSEQPYIKQLLNHLERLRRSNSPTLDSNSPAIIKERLKKYKEMSEMRKTIKDLQSTNYMTLIELLKTIVIQKKNPFNFTNHSRHTGKQTGSVPSNNNNPRQAKYKKGDKIYYNGKLYKVEKVDHPGQQYEIKMIHGDRDPKHVPFESNRIKNVFYNIGKVTQEVGGDAEIMLNKLKKNQNNIDKLFIEAKKILNSLV